MISLGVPDSHGRFSYWLPSLKVELPSPSWEIGTLGFGDFELPSSLSRSDSLYIYIYFVFCVKGLCDKASKNSRKSHSCRFSRPKRTRTRSALFEVPSFFLKSNELSKLILEQLRDSTKVLKESMVDSGLEFKPLFRLFPLPFLPKYWITTVCG